MYSFLGGNGMRISIDVSAEEIEALAQLSENKGLSSFVDKVLQESARVSVQNITEAREIQEVNPYSSSVV